MPATSELHIYHPPSSSSIITSLPILVLNIHTRCNCRCIMCDIWKRDTSTEIHAAALERHRESLHRLGVRRVVLTGGEPLLHSDLPTLCSFFQEQEIALTLLTTGLLLQKRAPEIARYFDDIIVSLDGPAAIHDSIRRIIGAHNLIRDGVAAVRRLNPPIPIHARTTIQKANHRHLCETVESAINLTLDSISFLAIDLTSEAFNRPLLWPTERQSQLALDPEEIIALEQEIEMLITMREAQPQPFIVESAAKLSRIPRHFRAHRGEFSHESPPCNAPWVSAVVEVDGSVRPCFFHPPIGEIRDSTLEEAINSNFARSFRQSLDISRNPTCQRCVCSLNYREQPWSG
jgi:MoaA/NifB/PqqE/SkfB family radical SAM enzyme